MSSTRSATDNGTPTSLAPGAPAGFFPLSGFDNINLYNGHLNFTLPLLPIGGRGAAGYTPTLKIERTWRSASYRYSSGPGDFNWNTPRYTPLPNEWVGLTPGLSPGVLIGRRGRDRDPSPIQPLPGAGYTCRTLTRLTFIQADGTETELRDHQTSGEPHESGTGTYSRGALFASSDGSQMSFQSDAAIMDVLCTDTSWPAMNGANMFFPSGYLRTGDGTTYRIDNGVVSWLRDRNGNKLTIDNGNSNGSLFSATDNLGRTVMLNSSYNQYNLGGSIVYQGAGGNSRSISTNTANLADCLRTGYTIRTYKSLFPGHEMASDTNTFNPIVVSSVTLPDGRSYQFRYNDYGELARVELPTGGAFEYDYTAGSGELNYSHRGIYRRVMEKRTYDGTTLVSRTTFNESLVGTTGSLIDVRVYDSANQLLSWTKHYYYNDAAHELAYPSPNFYQPYTDGREYKTEMLDAQGNVSQRIENTWLQQGTEVKPANVYLAATKTTLLPANLVTQKTFSYDGKLNQTDVYEYDYGTGAPGPLLRRTHTDYVTDPDYTNDTGTHLTHLPSQTWVATDAAGTNPQALTQYEYDIYTADGNHAALLPRSNISGHDTAFGISYTRRGNVTATTSYANVNSLTASEPVTSFAHYDIAGNVVKTLDARGKATTVSYDDCFGAPDGVARNITGQQPPICAAPASLNGQQSFAFPTSATNALGHNSYAQFDYWLGAAVDAEDANGVVSSTYFDNDPLDRPRRRVAAANVPTLKQQTTLTYDDTNRIVTQQRDLKAWNDGLIKSQSFYDTLGRTTETRSYIYETHAAYLYTRTEYDGLGRPWRVSQPRKANQSLSAEHWTETAYDSLGRVTQVVTKADNATVQTFYDGNRVLVQDPTGKRRMSQTDALGRLTTVWEITPADQWTEAVTFASQPELQAYRTSYAYDVLGNLTQVTQGAQQRYFYYDSLSRLRAAKNPEQSGTVALTGDFAGLPAGAAGWSMAYRYDANGNLLTRRDARNVDTYYTYDDLNRNTQVTYSDGTPAVMRRYDAAVPYGTGQLWQTETANTSLVTFSNFDALGRPATLQQKFWQTGLADWNAAPAYNLSRTYNLTTLKNQTYPSGHIVHYEYDDAGRLADKNATEQAFRGNLGDGVTRKYAQELQYGVFGLERETYRTLTPLYHKQQYNGRGQLWDVQLGTDSSFGPTTPDVTNAAWNRGRIVNHYASNFQLGQSGNDNNGNLLRQEIYLPNAHFTQQNYSYDALNRLTSAAETFNGTGAEQWRQQYDYDRWGNRTINQTATTGYGVPKPNLATNTANNRLGVPHGMTGQMTYDETGNLNYDNYMGAGTRTFDAENRMKEAWNGVPTNGYRQGQYTYDGDGRRIARTAANATTWQVYGFEGELVAEYAAQASPLLAQKEYGYQGGKLLISALNGDESRLRRFVENFYYRTWLTQPDNATIQNHINALAAQGLISHAAMLQHAQQFAASLFTSAHYLDRDTTNGMYVADLYLAYLQRPPDAGGFTYWKAQLDNDQISREALRDAFAGVGYSPSEFGGLTDALRGNYPVTPGVQNAGDYDRVDRFVNYLYTAASANGQTPPSTAQRDAEHTRFDVAEAQSREAVRSAAQQLGRDLLGATANNYRAEWSDEKYVTRLYTVCLRQAPDKGYEEWVTQAGQNGGRATVLEEFLGRAAYREQAEALYREIYWLVGDHLGTPRLIVERTGSLAGTKRHDYLPFGEELPIGAGGRATNQGYSYTGDSVRQQFTGYERDDETGLDYAQARYYSSGMGRFISVDPLTASADVIEPQSWNRYAYVLNRPLIFIDPSGLTPIWLHNFQTGNYHAVDSDDYKEGNEFYDSSDWVPVPPGLIGPEGVTFNLNQGSYTGDDRYSHLVGQNVYLGSDGLLHAVGDTGNAISDFLTQPIDGSGAALEQAIGQDYLPDSVELSAGFLGAGGTGKITRNGDILGGFNGNLLDTIIGNPSHVKSLINKQRIVPSVSLMFNKTLRLGRMRQEERLGIESGLTIGIGGGKVIGGQILYAPGTGDVIIGIGLTTPGLYLGGSYTEPLTSIPFGW